MFPLWGFGDYNKIVYTRGRTEQEAYIRASKNWQRGETITCLPYLPIDTAIKYSQNHPFDWLNTPPRWLQKV